MPKLNPIDKRDGTNEASVEALTRPLYTINEAAFALCCSRRMIYKLIEARRLKTARLGPASQRITGSTLRAVAEGRR